MFMIFVTFIRRTISCVRTTRCSSPHPPSGMLSSAATNMMMSLQRSTICRGLIGPGRQFGKGALYHPQLFALIIGAFLPIPFWLWQRRYPSSWIKFISTPVILNGVAAIPPATGINYSSWFAVGFIFQYVVRKRNFAWWSKFNYITSAALDSGECHMLMNHRSRAKGARCRHCLIINCDFLHIGREYCFFPEWMELNLIKIYSSRKGE
jgi:hypothetical protein